METRLTGELIGLIALAGYVMIVCIMYGLRAG